MTQRLHLTRPFPSGMVRENPSGGGSYVPHPQYTQRLLLYTDGYSFEKVDILRGDVAGIEPNPNGKSQRAKDGRPALTNVVVGVVWRLTVTIDGITHVLEDGGDCEDPHNWPHDGARLKDAISDALKRCCRHSGLGLHLYVRDSGDYVLYRLLKDAEQPAETQTWDAETGEIQQVPGQQQWDPDDPGRPFEAA